MERPRIANKWIAALLSWVIATGLVSGIFILVQKIQGNPVNWGVVRNAALIAAALAVVNAVRDRR